MYSVNVLSECLSRRLVHRRRLVALRLIYTMNNNPDLYGEGGGGEQGPLTLAAGSSSTTY